MERFVNVLPTIIMIEMFVASVPLFYYKQYGSALYWFAAGLINLAVIFGIKYYG